MDDRDGWWENVREIRAGRTTWWWWLLCITNNSSKRHSFSNAQLNVKAVLFQLNQFCINTLFNSIWPIDKTLSVFTSPRPNESGSDGNKAVVCITQCSSINGSWPSGCLESYAEHWMVESSPLQDKRNSNFYLTAENFNIMKYFYMKLMTWPANRMV